MVTVEDQAVRPPAGDRVSIRKRLHGVRRERKRKVEMQGGSSGKKERVEENWSGSARRLLS